MKRNWILATVATAGLAGSMMAADLAVNSPTVVATNAAAFAPEEGKTVELFDGKTLKGWRTYKKKEGHKGWVVEDGALFRNGGGGDLATVEQYDNFILELEWKISPGGNSGIMYRVTEEEGAPYMTGPEYQVLDDDKHGDGKNPKTSAGSLYALYAPEGKTLKPVGEWNSTKIVLNGSKVEHWLNGKKVVSAEIGTEQWNKDVANSKFKDWKRFGKNTKGYIVLQDHGNKVWYRNIKLTPLSGK